MNMQRNNRNILNVHVYIYIYVPPSCLHDVYTWNHIGVKVSVLTLSVVDREFESRSGQTKDY